jgi:hypothetical protein
VEFLRGNSSHCLHANFMSITHAQICKTKLQAKSKINTSIKCMQQQRFSLSNDIGLLTVNVHMEYIKTNSCLRHWLYALFHFIGLFGKYMLCCTFRHVEILSHWFICRCSWTCFIAIFFLLIVNVSMMSKKEKKCTIYYFLYGKL